MLTLCFATVIISVTVSALCSITEAALYAVPLAHIRHLSDSGSYSGKILLRFKEDIGKPIAAILILNTMSNTAGPTIAGGAILTLYGQPGVAVLSVTFTLLILFFSEILPKQAGIRYCKQVSLATAIPLRSVIYLLTPLIWVAQFIGRIVPAGGGIPSVSQEEFLSMADLGSEEGVLDVLEATVIKNLIHLDAVSVRDILTPRVVVFRLEDSLTIGNVSADIASWEHTRVPLFSAENPDVVDRYVIQRELYRLMIQNRLDVPLAEVARPMRVVPEQMRADKLFVVLLSSAEHICAAVDEHGGFAGIVTLEDVIEELVGKEITDEFDKATDLRVYAKRLLKKHGRLG